ncbi:MAG TPA: TlpA disulfide reductase family protein [Ignavibacteriales bacterium]|nr:TlpA disulfide reductase family protein [Ignavibacteriales bacterium]
MSQNKPKERKIGNKQQAKKPLIDPKYKNLVFTGILVLVIAIFFIVNNSRNEPSEGPYPPNYKGAAVNSELTTTSGQKIKLSDYKGKVVLLDFWATWCPPCRKGIPDLIALKNEFKGKDFEIIGISVDQENTVNDVVPFIQQYGINYPVVYYDPMALSSFGAIESIPSSFVLDKTGKVVSSYVGLTEKSNFEKDIKKALGES